MVSRLSSQTANATGTAVSVAQAARIDPPASATIASGAAPATCAEPKANAGIRVTTVYRGSRAGASSGAALRNPVLVQRRQALILVFDEQPPFLALFNCRNSAEK